VLGELCLLPPLAARRLQHLSWKSLP